jgi:hypothetical protein
MNNFAPASGIAMQQTKNLKYVITD